MSRTASQRTSFVTVCAIFFAAAAVAFLAGATRNIAQSRDLDRQSSRAPAIVTEAPEARIQWKSGATLTPRMTPEQISAVFGDAATTSQVHVAVQFERPVSLKERADLESAGVRLLSHLSDDAYFAAIDPAFMNASVAAYSAPLRWASPIEIAWKLHPMYLDGRIAEWTIVENDKPAGQTVSAGPNPVVAALVLFHADVDPDLGSSTALQHGATVVTALIGVNAIVVHIPYQTVNSLAGEDVVQWIEPPLPGLTPNNLENRALTGANIVHAAPYNLDGSGVRAFIFDAGTVDTSHDDFLGRATVIDASGTGGHATHVSGTVGGSGVLSGGAQKGMAPGVHIVSAGFQWGAGGVFLYTNPGDIEADYGNAINNHGVDISNNSIGTNTEFNGFDCAIQGDYGLTDSIIDAIVRGSLSGGEPFRIVWADGNERGGTRCDVEGFGRYYSTAPPATAKNHMTVGAVNANDDSMTDFSSWGPTDDGRMKPDISAPGCQNGGDGGVTSTVPGDSYASACGTSMASPTVCGLSCLLLQDFRANYPGLPDPRNSTLRAIFAHTAVDRGNAGPDYQFGYGSVRIQPAIDFERSGRFIEQSVNQGGVYVALVAVGAGATELKVTLAWDDPPGTPNVVPALINNLDLRVFDPSNVQRHVWTLDKLNPSAPAVQTGPNAVDNIEQVYIANPAAGVYRIEVAGTSVPNGPQVFSLAASPSLINCSHKGIASFNQTRYACASTALIRVVDCDLNTDDETQQSINVMVISDSEPGGEAVVLTETGGSTAAFEGTIAISATNAAGVLLVSEGDSVSFTYLDADDGAGGVNVPVVASAVVDCTPPQISNVSVVNIKPRKATITYTTDEPASSGADYGNACASLSSSASISGRRTSHSIQLSGLTEDQTHYFRLVSTDEAGNMAMSDNGGACYSFTTLPLMNYFTEHFAEDDNDLDNRSITFTPGGPNGYTGCVRPNLDFPVNPTGGTVIPMSDDSSVLVSLTGGATVTLYGQTYSSMYVSANGYVTFNNPDFTYIESTAAHFSQPRVSALFDDLSPQNGGQVSWKQFNGGVAVTWLNTPQFFDDDLNSFQIVFFVDGRIQLNYLSIDATDGIAGLSAGLGLDPDFEETDLSAQGPCGTPLAVNGNAAGPSNTPIEIPLVAVDDGQPGPLSYKITRLPGFSLFDTGNNHRITPAELPYTLVNNGNRVTYVPGAGYNGLDAFEFRANDGGAPPAGGDSNTAVIAIAIGSPQPIHSFPLDSNPGWSTQGQWAFGVPTGGGSAAGDPTSGFTGANVYGYNLNGNYTNNINPPLYLTTSAMDCTGLSGTRLRFRRWLGIDAAIFDRASIEASTDGTNWTVVWNHAGPAINENAWSLQDYDIAAVADNKPAVYIRWAMGTTNNSIVRPGWNIDDIEIVAMYASPPCDPCDANCDGSVNQFDIQPFINTLVSHNGCRACSGDTNGNGTVNQFDINAFVECLTD